MIVILILLLLFDSNIDFIITVGNETKYTDRYLKNMGYTKLMHFDNEKDTYEYISNLLKSGDIILFKGSHGMHLSNIVTYF